VYFTPPASRRRLPIQVQAGQFAFYFRYPGPRWHFGPIHADQISEANATLFWPRYHTRPDSKDDIVAAEMAIPVNREIHLLMHSKVWDTPSTSRIARPAGFRAGTGRRPSFHGHQIGKYGNRLYPALWPRALQHEGLSRSEVAGRLRTPWDQTASGIAVAFERAQL